MPFQKKPHTLRRLLAGAFIMLMLAWLAGAVLVVVQGLTCRAAKADLTVVFGNGLLRDGTPAPILAARLDVAARCYRAGNCPLLFVSGSVDGPGLDEAKAMREYLLAHGVSADRIVSDEAGNNTFATVQHAVAYNGGAPAFERAGYQPLLPSATRQADVQGGGHYAGVWRGRLSRTVFRIWYLFDVV